MVQKSDYVTEMILFTSSLFIQQKQFRYKQFVQQARWRHFFRFNFARIDKTVYFINSPILYISQKHGQIFC